MTHMPNLRECIGGVPLIVRLASQDIVHPSEKPAPIAFVLPRTTLLIAVLKDLLQMFAPYAVALNKFSTQVWFSFNNLPIPWIYPIGAVKDYITELRRLKALDSNINTVNNSEHETPFENIDGKYKDENARAQMEFTLTAKPVELYFHIHPQSRNSVIERVIPAVIDYEHLDTFIRNEVRQWHKATYTAIYGMYKYYHNLMEAVLMPVLAMALYRPFDTQESRPLLTFMKMNSESTTTTEHQEKQALEHKAETENKEEKSNSNTSVHKSTSASPQLTTSESTTLPAYSSSSLIAQEAFPFQANTRSDKDQNLGSISVSNSLQPELTSPYLLTEYQHILQEKLSRPRVSFILSIAIPFVQYYVSETDTTYEQHPLTFQLCRVSAAPMKCIKEKEKEEKEPLASVANSTNVGSDLVEDMQSANREGDIEPDSEERKQEQLSHDLEIDATPLGLLIWRAFRLPYFRWMRNTNERNTHLESENHTSTTKVDSSSNGTERSDSKTKSIDVNDYNSSARTNKQRDLFFAGLSFCYEGAPYDVMYADQEGLRTTLSTEAVRWASWEAEMVHRLINVYDTHGIYVPNRIDTNNNKDKNDNNNTKEESTSTSAIRTSSNNSTQSQLKRRRMYFEVQGTQPPLCTPASFIELNFTSSDRSIYITVQVY